MPLAALLAGAVALAAAVLPLPALPSLESAVPVEIPWVREAAQRAQVLAALPARPVAAVPAVAAATAGVPAAPAVTASPTLRSVQLTWPTVAADPAVTGYTVYRGTTPDDLTQYGTVGPTSLGRQPGRHGFGDVATTLGTTYHYAVSATNADGEGLRSETVAAAPAPTGVLVQSDHWRDGDLTNLADDIGALGADGAATRFTFMPGLHMDPTASPDGSSIAYSSNGGGHDWDIWIQRIGSEPRRLTTGVSYADGQPAFSPDGRTVAFTRYRTDVVGPPATSVWTVPVDDGPPPVQVPGTTGDSTPRWAPSGRMLAVAHRDAQGTGIVVTTPDGGLRRTFVQALFSSPTKATLGEPSISPDGTRLSFVAVHEDAHVLNIVSDSGTAVAEFGTIFSQQWAPGGGRILVSGTLGTSDNLLWSVGTEPGNRTIKPLPNTSGGVLLSPVAAEPWAAYTPPALPPVSGVTGTLLPDAVELTWTNPALGSCAACTAGVTVRRGAAGGEAPATASAGIAVYTGSGTKARAGGLEKGAAYRFSIFPLGTRGDAGPAVTIAATPADLPQMLGPTNSLRALVGDGPKFTVSWGHALPAGQSFEIQIGTRDLTRSVGEYDMPVYLWKAFYTGTATSKVVNAVGGEGFWFRPRIRDSDGNATPWGALLLVPVPYDDRAFKASAGWTNQTKQKGRYIGTIRLASKAGSALTMSVPGGQYVLYADRCALCGKFSVYVDGKLVRTVDTYAKATATRQAVWANYYALPGPHTVRLVVAGTAKRPNVRIDGFAVSR